LVSDAATLSLQPDARGCWIIGGLTGTTRPVPWQRHDYGLLSILTLCRWVMRRDVEPLALDFAHPPPPDLAPYPNAFGGAALRFDRPEHRMLLAGADMLAPIPTHDPALSQVHERLIGERLQHLGQSSTSCRASREIARRLPGGEPRREEV